MYLRSPRWTHPIIGVAACLSGAIVLWYHRPLPVDHQTHENYTQPSNCTGKGPTGTASLLRNNVFRRRSRRGQRKGENEGTAIRPTTCYIADTGCGYCAREDGENTQIKWRIFFSACAYSISLARLSIVHFTPSLHSHCHHHTLALPHPLYAFYISIAYNQNFISVHLRPQLANYRIVLTTATFIVPTSLLFRPFVFSFSMVPLSYLVDNASMYHLASVNSCIGSYLLFYFNVRLMN